jgi:hypothetical protein
LRAYRDQQARQARPYNKACPRTSLGSQPAVTLRQLLLGRLTRIAADLIGSRMEAGRGSGHANLDALRSFYGNRAVADLAGWSGRIAVAALAAAAAEPSGIRLPSIVPGPYGGGMC